MPIYESKTEFARGKTTHRYFLKKTELVYQCKSYTTLKGKNKSRQYSANEQQIIIQHKPK